MASEKLRGHDFNENGRHQGREKKVLTLRGELMASAHSGTGGRNIDLGVKVGQSVTVRQEMSLLGSFSYPMVVVGIAQSSLLPHAGGPIQRRCVLRGLL